MIFNVASSPAAGQAALFPVLGVISARQRKIRLPAKAKACDVGADAAYRISTLHRRCLHDVI
jgi:hypothetical protein